MNPVWSAEMLEVVEIEWKSQCPITDGHFDNAGSLRWLLDIGFFVETHNCWRDFWHYTAVFNLEANTVLSSKEYPVLDVM